RESINEANIEIRNRQRTVNAYERIAQKQQEAQEISTKLKEMEIDYHSRCLSKLADETRNIEEELKQRELSREELQDKLNKNENIIDKYKGELSGTELKLNESRDKLNFINLQINEIQTSISIAEQRIKYLQENIDRFSREKVEIEKEIENLNNSKREIEEKIVVLKNTLELMKKSQTTKKTVLDENDIKVKSSKEELKDLTQKHASSSKTLLEKRNDYTIIKNRLEDQITRCSKLTDENIANINKISSFDRDISDTETELARYKEILSALTRDHDEQKKIKDSYAAEMNRLEKDIIFRGHEAEKLKNKIEFLTNLLENFDDYSEGIKFLIKGRNESEARVVIDMLEVEDKFKIAVEAALGEI